MTLALLSDRAVRYTDGREIHVIAVNPGDLGTRFRFMRGEESHKAQQRKVSTKRVAELKTLKERDYDRLSVNVLHLMRLMGDNENFWILDGQHRIRAAEESGGAEFLAIVYPADWFKAAPGILTDVNLGKQMSPADRFRASELSSPWPKPVQAAGVSIGFSGKNGQFSWVNVLKAYVHARACIQAGKWLHKSGAALLPEASLLWEEAGKEDIQRVIKVLSWWQPLAARAASHAETRVLSSYALLVFAFLYYDQFYKSRTQMKKAERIPHLAILHSVPSEGGKIRGMKGPDGLPAPGSHQMLWTELGLPWVY